MDQISPAPITEKDNEIVAIVLRERAKLGNFIRRRVLDQSDAEDILQDVFYEFVEAYRLHAPIELIGAWLFRVARNRIIDRFRKKKELSVSTATDDPDDEADEYRLDLALPSPEAGPEAQYARSVLLKTLQQALDDLPDNQRDVFVGHEIDGLSFKEMAVRTGVAVNTLLARKRYAVTYLRVRLQTVYDEFET